MHTVPHPDVAEATQALVVGYLEFEEPENLALHIVARIIVHRDRDQAGRDRVEKVTRSLGQALVLKSRRDVGDIFIAEPAVDGHEGDGKDVADHLEAGFGVDEFILTPFDFDPRKEPDPAPAPARPTRDRGDAGDSPIDVFFDRIDWADLLEPAGWELVGAEEDGKRLWKHPGATHDMSATTDHAGVPVLVNFSGNAGLPVGEGQRLTKFRVWSWLQFGGDEQAAGKVLRRAIREGQR